MEARIHAKRLRDERGQDCASYQLLCRFPREARGPGAPVRGMNDAASISSTPAIGRGPCTDPRRVPKHSSCRPLPPTLPLLRNILARLELVVSSHLAFRMESTCTCHPPFGPHTNAVICQAPHQRACQRCNPARRTRNAGRLIQGLSPWLR